MKCLSLVQTFPPDARVTPTQTALVHAGEFPVPTLPVCVAGKGGRPGRYGMTAGGTDPAFPSAPAVRAKPERGEMADTRTHTHSCTQGHQKKKKRGRGHLSLGR